MPTSLDILKSLTINYFKQYQTEEAFACLYYICQNHSVECYNARGIIGKADMLDPDLYIDSDDTDALLDTFKYDNHLFADIVYSSPLDALWILDKYLYHRPTLQSSQHQKIIIEVNKEQIPIYIIKREPSIALNIHTSPQVSDLKKHHPCHSFVSGTISNINVEISSVDSETELFLEQIDNLNAKHIYVTNLSDNANTKWTQHNAGVIANDISDSDDRIREVTKHLEAAARQNKYIVVFPELTMTKEIRNEISKWLFQNRNDCRSAGQNASNHNICWVVAGSFHEKISDNTGHWINRSYSFGHYGQVIHKHTKLSSAGRITTPDKGNFYEDIYLWKDIYLLTTNLGLVSTPICLDFCQTNPDAIVENIVTKIPLALCLVPAMDYTSSAHYKQAVNCNRFHGTLSAVAVQHPKGGTELNTSFIYPLDESRKK